MLKTLERITGEGESTKLWESVSRSFQRQDLGDRRRREGQDEKSLPGRGNGGCGGPERAGELCTGAGSVGEGGRWGHGVPGL